jgi:anti-repressor protein
MEANDMTNEIAIRVQKEIQNFLSNPNNIIQAYQKALEERDFQIAIMQPKADIWDMAMGSDRLEEMSAVAKILNFKDMGRNKLFGYLRERNILRENNEPYQKHVDSCCFKVITQTVKVNDYTIINNKTMVTQKGLDFISKMLGEDGYELNPR